MGQLCHPIFGEGSGCWCFPTKEKEKRDRGSPPLIFFLKILYLTLPITVQCENLTQSHNESWASLRLHIQTLAKIHPPEPDYPILFPSHQDTSYHCKTKYLHLPLKVIFCLLSLYCCICSLCWKTLPFPPKTTLTHPFRWEAAEVPNPRDLKPALYKVLLIFWKVLCVSTHCSCHSPGRQHASPLHLTHHQA